MQGNHINTCNWLLPAAWLYGIGVKVRNTLFDMRVLRSRSYGLPLICVGNLTVGGTGKTPHTEYLLRLLSPQYANGEVAVLSRGYKRRSKGFRLASAGTSMEEIGDEPYQMMCKFPNVRIAVDADRCHGIKRLMSETNVKAIILDDAFQHRYVKAGLNILLTDYNRLFCFDKLMPAGRLREQVSGKSRADIVVVTKCPQDISAEERNEIGRSLNLDKQQKLFFSTFNYGKPYPLFAGGTTNELTGRDILLLTGIASPKPLEQHLAESVQSIDRLDYPDHHNFTPNDIAEIETKGKGKVIVTTEKDAARLHALGKGAFSDAVAENIVVVPVEVAFIGDEQGIFDQTITNFAKSMT